MIEGMTDKQIDQLAEQLADDAIFGRIDRIAEICHEANRAYRIQLEETDNPRWLDAPEGQRESVRAGVRFRIENPAAPPAASHERWLQWKLDNGWRYGAEKNEEEKTHPQMVPFDMLPEEQKRKDVLFAAIVAALTYKF